MAPAAQATTPNLVGPFQAICEMRTRDDHVLSTPPSYMMKLGTETSTNAVYGWRSGRCLGCPPLTKPTPLVKWGEGVIRQQRWRRELDAQP